MALTPLPHVRKDDVVPFLLVLLPLAIEAISMLNSNVNIGIDISKLVTLLLITWIAWSFVVVAVRSLFGGLTQAAVVVGIGIYLSSFSTWSTMANRGKWIPIEFLSWLAATAVLGMISRLLSVRLAERIYLAFFVTSLVTGVVVLAIAKADDAPKPPAAAPLAIEKPSAHHDLVIVILDGFGRADVLEHLYGYDSKTITEGLNSIGARVIPDALANYTTTSFSVPSILSLGYLGWPSNDLGDGYRRELEDRAGGNNDIGRLLQENGYRYTFLEAPWSRSSCTEEIDRCVVAPFYDDVAESWIERATPLGMVFDAALGRAYPESVEPTMRQLRKAVGEAQANGTPDFVVAHVLSPHPPITLDEDCRVSSNATIATQTECVSRSVMGALQDVSGSTIIMVVGDHGPTTLGMAETPMAAWQDRELRERLPTLAAVRLLDGCAQPEDRTTLINVSRSAVACALGVHLSPIQDRVFLVGDDFDTGIFLSEKDAADYYNYAVEG